jgi:hypothetical protein
MFGMTGVQATGRIDTPKRSIYAGPKERIPDVCPNQIKNQLRLARKAARAMGIRLAEYLALPLDRREW